MVLADLKNALVGFLMGVVSQLPGASGATIAVIFRIYERLVADFADMRGKLLKDLRFILVVAVGGALGYLLCAKVLNNYIDDYYVPMLFLFGALITMQIPDIRRMADDGEGYSRNNILAFSIAFLIIVAIFVVKQTFSPDATDANWIMMVVAGFVVAGSFISPGISGSTMLLVLGIYPAFLAAIDDLNFRMLLPIAVGGIIGLIVFAKLIDHYMNVAKKSTYCAILGLTVGSVLVVFVEAFMKMDISNDIVKCIICVVAGIVLGYGLCRLARIYSDTN